MAIIVASRIKISICTNLARNNFQYVFDFQERFTLGYLDRFVGICEEPFQKFSNWGDLANAELDSLAVPQHRVQYFKYRGVKVWDKKERIDEVFGSTKRDTVGIIKFMEDVDESLKVPIAENELLSDSNSEDGTGLFDSDTSDSEDDEEGMTVNIAPIAQAPGCSVPAEDRSSHFLAIQITNNAVIENARLLQDHIVGQEEALAECCMKPSLYHVTLGMLRLSEAGAQEAIQLVSDLQPTLDEIAAAGVRLRIAGLDTFGQRVLYAKVQPEPDSKFWEFVSTVQNKISESSSEISVTNKFEFTPHMTLVKVNRPISR